jgi:RNA polymerase sigma-70 factor (ECF subfamily)
VSLDWNDLYRTVFPDLVRFLHRKVWDADRARDLAQEAFVRALEHEPRSPRSWLFQVASNLARDEARMVVRRKRHLALLKGEVESQRGSNSDPAEDVAHGDETARVRAALAELSERDREALLLWDAGMSYPEIARLTGLAVGAVGTTLARARRRLADVYRERERGRSDVARG